MLGHAYKLPLEPASERNLEAGDERKRITEDHRKALGCTDSVRIQRQRVPLAFGWASEYVTSPHKRQHPSPWQTPSL
jgi:hypothetical protein